MHCLGLNGSLLWTWIVGIFKSWFNRLHSNLGQQTSTDVQVLFNKWFYKFGILVDIYFDQGCSFESSLIQKLFTLYGVVKSNTNPCHLAGNEHCECFDWTLHNQETCANEQLL